MNQQHMPVLRIELEGMKFVMLQALDKHRLEMDQMIQEAVTRACDPEVIQSKLDVMAQQAIEAAIKSEIDSFYRYGEGREILKALISERLMKKAGDLI